MRGRSDWLSFDVDAFAAFEQVGADVMDRTVRQLNDRLALHLRFYAPARG